MGASASASKRSLPILGAQSHLAEIKILVLGCMGSGKSTLCRMLVKLAHGRPPVLGYYQHTIHNNLLELFRAVIDLALDMNISIEGYEDAISIIQDFRHRELLSDKVIGALSRLCVSHLYEEILRKDKRPPLPYNHAFFISNWERILRKDYMPTETDVIHSYSMTIGVDMQVVTMGNIQYEIFELPGHHVFRTKWKNFLSNTNVIIFVVDLSELCMQAFYSGHLKDKTLSIFKSLLNNELLRKTGFILLFNKKDLFDEWSQGYNFEQLAPQMRSGQEALSFYRNLFLHLSPVKKIYNHVVALTRAPNLSTSLVDSMSLIIKSNKENMQPV